MSQHRSVNRFDRQVLKYTEDMAKWRERFANEEFPRRGRGLSARDFPGDLLERTRGRFDNVRGWHTDPDRRKNDYLVKLANDFVWLLERRAAESETRRAVLGAVTLIVLRLLEQASSLERWQVDISRGIDAEPVPESLRLVATLTDCPRPGPAAAVAAAA
jgi:hypothetical protein